MTRPAPGRSAPLRPCAEMVSLRGRARQTMCRSAWTRGMTSTWTERLMACAGSLGSSKTCAMFTSHSVSTRPKRPGPMGEDSLWMLLCVFPGLKSNCRGEHFAAQHCRQPGALLLHLFRFQGGCVCQRGLLMSANKIHCRQEEAMEKARAGLRKTMRRLNRTYEQSKSNHILYLLLFAVGVFVLLYSWLKFYRLVKWIL